MKAKSQGGANQLSYHHKIRHIEHAYMPCIDNIIGFTNFNILVFMMKLPPQSMTSSGGLSHHF